MVERKKKKKKILSLPEANKFRLGDPDRGELELVHGGYNISLTGAV